MYQAPCFVISLSPYSNPVNRWHYYHHFRDKETEVQAAKELPQVHTA